MTPTTDVIAAPSPALEVPTDQAGYDAWRRTGEITPKGESATPGQSAEGEKPTETASEAVKQEAPVKQRGTAETRLQELLADLKTAGLSPAELKTFKREAQQAAPATPAKVEAPKAEPPKPKSTAPVRPAFGEIEGETWPDFKKREDEWFEGMESRVMEKIRAEQAHDAQIKGFRDQVDAASGRYGAEAEAKIGQSIDALVAAEIPAAVKAIINDSPVLIDLAYVLGDKAGDMDAFLALAKSNPSAAIRRVVLMEKLVQEELAKTPGAPADSATRGADGKFVSTKPPEKKVTAAPPLGTEVSGRGSAPADEVEQAAKNGDFATFQREQNRRDLERMRGR